MSDEQQPMTVRVDYDPKTNARSWTVSHFPEALTIDPGLVGTEQGDFCTIYLRLEMRATNGSAVYEYRTDPEREKPTFLIPMTRVE